MNPTIATHATLVRPLALVVRYWACNMTLVHDRGQSWPGFGYTPAEKDTLTGIARKVDSAEFFTWMTLVVVCFMAIAVLVVAGAVFWTTPATAVPPAATSSDTVGYLQLCSLIVVCLTVGFPLSMLVASQLCGWFFAPPDSALTDGPTTAHFIEKLMWQITRMAVLACGAVLAMLVFMPADSTAGQLLKAVMPILSPAVGILTLAYYGTTRLAKRAANR